MATWRGPSTSSAGSPPPPAFPADVVASINPASSPGLCLNYLLLAKAYRYFASSRLISHTATVGAMSPYNK